MWILHSPTDQMYLDGFDAILFKMEQFFVLQLRHCFQRCGGGGQQQLTVQSARSYGNSGENRATFHCWLVSKTRFGGNIQMVPSWISLPQVGVYGRSSCINFGVMRRPEFWQGLWRRVISSFLLCFLMDCLKLLSVQKLALEWFEDIWVYLSPRRWNYSLADSS